MEFRQIMEIIISNNPRKLGGWGKLLNVMNVTFPSGNTTEEECYTPNTYGFLGPYVARQMIVLWFGCQIARKIHWIPLNDI